MLTSARIRIEYFKQLKIMCAIVNIIYHIESTLLNCIIGSSRVHLTVGRLGEYNRWNSKWLGIEMVFFLFKKKSVCDFCFVMLDVLFIYNRSMLFLWLCVLICDWFWCYLNFKGGHGLLLDNFFWITSFWWLKIINWWVLTKIF